MKEVKIYDSYGRVTCIGKYDNNGNKHGIWRGYDFGGELREIVKFKRDKVVSQRYIGDKERRKKIEKIGIEKAKSIGLIL